MIFGNGRERDRCAEEESAAVFGKAESGLFADDKAFVKAGGFGGDDFGCLGGGGGGEIELVARVLGAGIVVSADEGESILLFSPGDFGVLALASKQCVRFAASGGYRVYAVGIFFRRGDGIGESFAIAS